MRTKRRSKKSRKTKKRTVGYGRQQTQSVPTISLTNLTKLIGIEFVDQNITPTTFVADFLKWFGYKKKPTPLGCGGYGCAYLVKSKNPKKSGFETAVLKLTNDIEEATCFNYLYDNKLWEKSENLPVIYNCGGPVSLKGFDEEIKSTLTRRQYRFKEFDIFWIIREELENNNLRESYYPWEREDMLYNLAKSIYKDTGFLPKDIHTDNWGQRNGVLVLRDLMCSTKKMKLNLPPVESLVEIFDEWNKSVLEE